MSVVIAVKPTFNKDFYRLIIVETNEFISIIVIEEIFNYNFICSILNAYFEKEYTNKRLKVPNYNLTADEVRKYKNSTANCLLHEIKLMN